MLKRDSRLLLPTRVKTPGFRVELRGTVFCLMASGSWTVREAGKLEAALKRLHVPIPPSPDFTGNLDLSEIEELDTAGALLLHRMATAWSATGLRTNYSGATESFQILIEEVRQRSNVTCPAVNTEFTIADFAGDLAKSVRNVGQDAVMLTAFLGEVTATVGRIIKEPWRFRPVSFIHHLEHTGLRAVPIIALICLLIGAVVMQQGVIQLRPFGADVFAVNMLGILSLREVGVLLTAIMVAGRSGSAFTAEIGSMKMREEIDAMRTLGIDPMETLVAPRVLALVVVMPLLTFVGDLMCLVGGGLMAMVYLGLDIPAYLEALHGALDIRHFLAGMVKAPIAALIIGLVGCLEGLKVTGSAESLGFHVTSAVVKAIFLVIVFDAVFAMFLSAVGI